LFDGNLASCTGREFTGGETYIHTFSGLKNKKKVARALKKNLVRAENKGRRLRDKKRYYSSVKALLLI